MNDIPAQLQQNVIFEKLYTIAEYSLNYSCPTNREYFKKTKS
jgi:hypothetical protein